jgi:hypothetical protein
MADSIRQKIVDELKRRLMAISITNGYETDLGGGPINEMPVSYQEEELPALGVFDVVNTVNQEYAQQKRLINELSCQVRVFLQRETDARQARKMIADIKRAVITDPTTKERDATLGGIAVDMQPEQDGPDVPKDSYQIDGAVVAFMVQFLAAPFNDYE